MQFVRIGEFVAVSRITGPSHNLLQLRLSEGRTSDRPTCERLPAQEACRHAPLDEPALVRAVQEGINEANNELGTSYSASHIRYVANDTKPEAVYAYLALSIVKQLVSGSEFTPSPNPSIERTISSELRPVPTAAHVKL